MILEHYVIIGLTLAVVGQYIWNAINMHRLVNKIMSQSYYDYQFSKQFKPKMPVAKPKLPDDKKPTSLDPAEVFATLNGINPLT